MENDLIYRETKKTFYKLIEGEKYLEKLDKLITWVENIKEKNGSSASALYIIKDNQVILEHYNGYHANSDKAPPITASSRFNVASARKSYLGLAVAFALYDREDQKPR